MASLTFVIASSIFAKWENIIVHLSRFTDLALRALMLLAVAEDRGDRMTAAHVATAVSASTGHVAKIISRLVHMGLIESRRGRKGGLSITRAGLDASVGEVLRELEGPGEIVECEGEQPCPLASGCQLRVALQTAREAFFGSLDAVSVSELINDETHELLLGLTPRTTEDTRSA